MPWRSRAQRAWAFANKKPWAKTWERHTKNVKRLPKRVRRKGSSRRKK